MAATRLPVCRQIPVSLQFGTGEGGSSAGFGAGALAKKNGSRLGESIHSAKRACTIRRSTLVRVAARAFVAAGALIGAVTGGGAAAVGATAAGAGASAFAEIG